MNHHDAPHSDHTGHDTPPKQPAPHTSAAADGTSTAVLEVSGVQWATSKNVVESVLSRRPGVVAVEANPVAQTATVTYQPRLTDLGTLRGWVRDCGYHCAGQSVPHLRPDGRSLRTRPPGPP